MIIGSAKPVERQAMQDAFEIRLAILIISKVLLGGWNREQKPFDFEGPV